MIRKLHEWTEAEETALSQAVMDLDALRAEYEARGVPAREFWSAVAGRLAPGVCVTGKACRERWKAIQDRMKQDLEKMDDVWEQLAVRVEVYERELGEATYDAAAETLRRIGLVGEGVTSIIGAMADCQALNDVAQSVAVNHAALLRVEAKVDRMLAEWGVKP